MYLMYVDESGDTGLVGSMTDYFVLSGLVVHESDWADVLSQILIFRKSMRDTFGLKLREEIHAGALINKPGPLVRIKRNDRLTILRAFANELSRLTQVRVINIVVDKRNKPPTYDVFEMAWKALVQRLENTINYSNFPVPSRPTDRGLIIPDATDDKKLRQLIRKMRYYNPITSLYGPSGRSLPLAKIVEDPWTKDSEHSYLIQTCDLVAYLLYQKLSPSKYIKKAAADKYFDRLLPVLCLHASTRDPLGIVRL